MSLHTDIRVALQEQAATAAGFPPLAQRAYEGKLFVPSTGTPWARMTMLPTSGRPFSVSAEDRFEKGLFQVDVFVPYGAGSNAAEVAADAVIAVFNPASTLKQNGLFVFVQYAERARVMEQEADWICAPVTVGWQAFPNAP